MSLHDEYARTTPFEIAFPDEARLKELVEAVMEESSSRSVDPELPGIFMTLGSVGDFVRELQTPNAPESALHQYGALVFHAVHFARAGRPTYLLETPAARGLVNSAPAGDPRPHESAGYLQLPQHLFWMDGSEGKAPESVDGLFWFVPKTDVIHVLPITGVLSDQPGFTALALPEAPLGDARQWLDADMRGSEPDYSSSLPGHDLDQLYSVESTGEVLKLLARFFAYLESTPAAREDVAAGEGGGPTESRTKGPSPSALPYTRVHLLA
jgi:hypothetical protein